MTEESDAVSPAGTGVVIRRYHDTLHLKVDNTERFIIKFQLETSIRGIIALSQVWKECDRKSGLSILFVYSLSCISINKMINY